MKLMLPSARYGESSSPRASSSSALCPGHFADEAPDAQSDGAVAPSALVTVGGAGIGQVRAKGETGFNPHRHHPS